MILVWSKPSKRYLPHRLGEPHCRLSSRSISYRRSPWFLASSMTSWPLELAGSLIALAHFSWTKTTLIFFFHIEKSPLPSNFSIPTLDSPILGRSSTVFFFDYMPKRSWNISALIPICRDKLAQPKHLRNKTRKWSRVRPVEQSDRPFLWTLKTRKNEHQEQREK